MSAQPVPFQTQCRDFVAREVYANMSQMIHFIFAEKHIEDEDFLSAMESYDHDVMWETFMEDADADEVAAELDVTLPETEEEYEAAGGIRNILDKAFQALAPMEQREFLQRMNVDPEYQEVFEYWSVSDWFADKLIDQGEPVIKDWNGHNIWGRRTTGQAIYIDYVVTNIYKNLIKD